MKWFNISVALSLGIFFTHASFVSAQTSVSPCVPSSGACVQTGTPHWEFDKVKNICYQPLAQCGGTQFATELDCQTACLNNPVITPVTTLTPLPTTVVTPTLTPPATDLTATPTIQPTPVLTTSTSPTAVPSCTKSDGDANKDGKTNLRDYEVFRQEYSGELTSVQSDFNCDGKVSLIDFEIFRKAITS